MTRRFLVLMLLWTLRPAAAAPRDVSIETFPGGAVVQEGGVTVASARAGERVSSYRWQADDQADHHYRLRRRFFDDATLAIEWNADQGRWALMSLGNSFPPAGGQVQTLPVKISFAKTIHLNVRPAVANVGIQESVSGLPAEETLAVEGIPLVLHRLAVSASGTVVLPGAYAPGPIYVTHPGFAPLTLSFKEGQLDTPGDRFPVDPVALHPRWGPLSYWQFNLAVAVVAGSALCWWLASALPRQRRRRAESQRIAFLASQIVSETAGKMPGADELPPLLGQTLETQRGEGFVVLSLLGRGAMGAVFEAAPVSLDRSVTERWAVKVLMRSAWEDKDFQGRFAREVHVCSTLQHPGIVKVLDWGLYHPPGTSDPNVAWPFMVMERVDGRTLAEVMAEPHLLAQKLAWCLEMLQALKVAHAAGIIHRDLKPDNVMITPILHVKIMDFGIARQMGQTITRSNAVMGTPVYMSPEHLNAKHVTPASDIYSIGVVMYEWLSGARPFEELDAWSIITRKLVEDPPPLDELCPSLPPALTDCVMKMMARRPEDRYQTADEAIAALTVAPLT